MTELRKATLTRLTAGDNPQEVLPAIAVQFNPATLRLALSNQTEGGQSRGRQERQFSGLSSTDLSFELVFDTADESAGGGRPRSVREKTALVEQFVLAESDSRDRNRRVVPPRVRFQWGDLKIDGVIQSLSIDFELFAADGTPLRAKMSVAIKEQNPRYELKQREQGQSSGSDPAPGAQSSAAPGAEGSPNTDRTLAALEGESAADFAQRAGLDPAAWRAVASLLDGTLSLEAGLELDFSAGVALGAGVSAGFSFEADASLSLEASLGLEAAVSANGGSGAAAGLSLSAAGGVSAAVESVTIAKTEAAASAALQAFVAGGTAVPKAARPSAFDQRRAPLRSLDAASPVTAVAAVVAAPAPPSPLADSRAASYGFGVPLRPRALGAAEARRRALAGRASVRPYARAAEVPVTRDPGAAPWEQLPVGGPAGSGAAPRRPSCRCASRCSCGGKSCR